MDKKTKRTKVRGYLSVVDIYQIRLSKVADADLARIYGVPTETISDIRSQKPGGTDGK